MDSPSPSPQPAFGDDPVLLQGTHNRPGAGSWFALLFGLLCAAAALKFCLFDDAVAVAPYPASVAVSAFGWFALAWLRKGVFELTPNWVTGHKRVGGRFQVALDQVAQVQVKEAEIRLLSAEGRVLVRLVAPRPAHVGGLLWFLVRYRGRLPRQVLGGLGQPAALDRHREVQPGMARTFWEAEGDASRKAFGDRGLLVSLGDRHLYFPRTETVEAPGIKDLLGLVLPVTWHRRLKLTDGPGLQALPVEAFVDRTLEADLDATQRAGLLGMVATELGGMDLTQAIGEDGSLWGELAGRTVSIQARAPDGLLTERGQAP